MYEACFFAPELERIYTVSARGAKEAVTRAWRAYMQDQMGEDEDVTTWEPEDLRVTAPYKEDLKDLSPITDEIGGLCVLVDLDRMTVPCGYVRKIT